ncbi:MAG: hypothetical protein RSD09_07050 [Bacilli bacterium]
MDLTKITIEPTPPLIKVERLIRQYNKLMLDISNTLKVEKGTNKLNSSTFEKSLEAIKNDEQLSEALETIPYNLLFDLAVDDSFQITDVTVLKLINKDKFKENILGYFDEIAIFKDRKKVIKEALDLYEKEYFAGCLCLLHSQLEGIITDYLLHKKIIKEEFDEYKKTHYIKYNGNIKNDKVSGLFKKIDLSKNINKNFLRLKEYKLDSNENIQFWDARNKVLHGSNINDFNDKTCFIVFIWINSILTSIKEEFGS